MCVKVTEMFKNDVPQRKTGAWIHSSIKGSGHGGNSLNSEAQSTFSAAISNSSEDTFLLVTTHNM